MPQHFQGGPPPGFHQLRHHTPSSSPPIPNGMVFHGGVQRAHTPQPHPGSRPGSRNDMRRMGGQLVAPPVGSYGPPHPSPQVNGYAYVPQPAIYNPQNAQNMPPGGQYPHPPPPHMQMHMENQQRQSSVPPSFPPQQHQQSPPQPVRHSLSPPQQRHGLPDGPLRRASPQPPRPQSMQPPSQDDMPAPMEPRSEINERSAPQPQPPMGDIPSAIKKMPQRKQHSIFTPIEENRSVLSQHLAAFAESHIKSEPNGNRAPSLESPGASRNTASPPQHKRPESGPSPQRRQTSVSSIPEPPSRSNSMRVGGPSRPRLKVQIPDEPSEAGSNTAESTSGGPGHSTDATSQGTRHDGSHSSGIVLPPPSPSAATTLLSAGATGPPNPFARPAPSNNNPPPPSHNLIDTPASALPSRYMTNEFLPSPSQFFPDLYNRNHEGNTLPSPLNFATPVVGSGPSFLREEASNLKRKSPEITSNGSSSDPVEPSSEPKRLKVGN